VIGGCNALRGQCGILWNGDLVLCCGDFDGQTVLGNMSTSSISDILNSDYAVKIRKNFSRGILVHPFCKKCRGGTTLKTALARQFGSLIINAQYLKYGRLLTPLEWIKSWIR